MDIKFKQNNLRMPYNMDIVIKNALLVTVDEERRVLKDHSIAIENGGIVEISNNIVGETEIKIDGKGKLVMPGLVNAHTHLAMTLFRGTADDVPLMKWLQEEIWPIENNLNGENVRAGSLLGILEMIKSGTTCFNDMYWHLDEVARCVEESGIRAVLSTPLLDVMGPEQGQKLLKEGEESIKRYRSSERIVPFFGPHAPYTCSEELLLETKDLAEKHQTGMHIHVAETEEEVENSKKDKGARPFEYLDRIGFLDEDVIAAHSVWVSKTEMDIIKNRKTKVCHNPISNMKLGSGVAPVPEFLEKGITVSLGTDGAASNNNLDMFEDMKVCALLHKVHNSNASLVPALNALELATINGARALGLEDKIGSIEVGKRADVLMLDLQGSAMVPMTNPVSHLVYSVQGGNVETVIVDGKILMEDRQMRTLDENQVIEFAREQAKDLFERSGKKDHLLGV
ncbi:MAG: amidohydrolase [Candidatus Hydrothermarchaeales archaeon]